MKTFKRILSGVLAAAMTIGAASMISVNAANVTFTDVASDHWAWTNGSIPYLVEKGVINGYKQDNGTYIFNPSNAVTRAEFIKMLDEVFGLEETASISFSDVKSGSWFYPYFQKAAAQGYILNYGSNANPDGAIPREEAIALLVRYLDLPANEKAEASQFADYSSISDSYKDYVLRAIYAGLINGYNEDGKTYFKPKNTLTRAEALTILYRAAGCIFDASAYSREASAPDTNSVITGTGITINNVRFNGRSIVSEGADNGKITFSNCDINGTLYIRGSSGVTFDDCTVENVVVYGGGDISLLDGTVIENMTLESKSNIGAYSGTKINSLSVEFSADNAKVAGDGSLGKVSINARGFSSSMMPSEFEIGNNLTASFNGSSYSGSSDAQNAFTVAPFTTADENNAYINVISDIEGKIYYYYTNLSDQPTVSSFDSYFDSSSYSGSFEIKKGEAASTSTFSLSTVKNFEYVVLQLRDGNRKYAPVIVDNFSETGTGFTTDPYLDDALTIKFKPATSATIYWFYADDGKNLTPIEFIEAYADKETALKGEEAVTSIKSFTCALKDKYLENYSYVAFMLKTGAGVYYTPVIVSVGNTGFTDAPVVKTPGVITFKANTAGDIYYYYSKTNDLPSIADFKGEYNAAKYSDNDDIRRNVTQEIDFDLKRIEDYPYMILAIRNDDGDYMQPVVVDINFTTGFRNEPYVDSSTEIKFRAEEDGKVKYYYTKTSTSPTVEQFNEGYSDVPSTKYRGEMKVGVYYETIEYNVNYVANYPYMAIMYIDEYGKEYSPVLVELDATLDTGFEIAPYASNGKIYFRTDDSGEVWYYYSEEDDSVSAKEFEDYYDDEPSKRRGTITVSAGSTYSITLDEDILEDYPYIVLAFTEDTSSPRDFEFPYVIDVEQSELSGAGSGLKVGSPDSDGEVRVEALYEGTLYYYRTNDEDELPTSISNFKTRYNAAGSDDKDYISIDKNDREYLEFKECDYIVCALKVDSDYLDYVVIHHKNGVEKDEEEEEEILAHDASGYGFKITGYGVDSWSLEANHDGTVRLIAYSNGTTTTLDSVDCDKDEEVELELPSYLSADSFISDLILGNVKYYIQLTTSSGTTYEALPISVIN